MLATWQNLTNQTEYWCPLKLMSQRFLPLCWEKLFEWEKTKFILLSRAVRNLHLVPPLLQCNEEELWEDLAFFLANFFFFLATIPLLFSSFIFLSLPVLLLLSVLHSFFLLLPVCHLLLSLCPLLSHCLSVLSGSFLIKRTSLQSVWLVQQRKSLFCPRPLYNMWMSASWTCMWIPNG